MIANNLKTDFPFVSNYFEQLFKVNIKKFPQSIVFEGLDAYAQCFFALELARILNCLEGGEENCQCLNCRWIRENKHPAINFVSQIHFKPQGDDSKTVISAAQAKEIEKSLRETSDYHRFFIFFDAKQAPPDLEHKNSHKNYSPEGYNICPDEDWYLDHINQKTFNPSTPNVLLKCVEEPPERTTFVFLTKNRADLINTIVSRSQCFKLPTSVKRQDFGFILPYFEKYPSMPLSCALNSSEELQNYIKENEMPIDLLLDTILSYLSFELKNADSAGYVLKLKQDIKALSEAKRHHSAQMSDKVVLDTLFLKMAGDIK